MTDPSVLEVVVTDNQMDIGYQYDVDGTYYETHNTHKESELKSDTQPPNGYAQSCFDGIFFSIKWPPRFFQKCPRLDLHFFILNIFFIIIIYYFFRVGIKKLHLKFSNFLKQSTCLD